MFGVAVLAAVFTANGGYHSGQQFVDGMNPAVMIGAALVAVGAIAAFAIKGSPRTARIARSTPTPHCSRPARAPRAGAPHLTKVWAPETKTHRLKTKSHRRYKSPSSWRRDDRLHVKAAAFGSTAETLLMTTTPGAGAPA